MLSCVMAIYTRVTLIVMPNHLLCQSHHRANTSVSYKMAIMCMAFLQNGTRYLLITAGLCLPPGSRATPIMMPNCLLHRCHHKVGAAHAMVPDLQVHSELLAVSSLITK